MFEGEGSMVLRRTVCGEAVERSVGRRRTVDSSPFHTPEKESPLPPRTVDSSPFHTPEKESPLPSAPVLAGLAFFETGAAQHDGHRIVALMTGKLIEDVVEFLERKLAAPRLSVRRRIVDRELV